ncbi:MAG: hypothetical protein IOD12_03190 [Silvanigrellales bacterium]|jgi:hypothetical protein|nr:hypothetical protein [Silvanigrellales bacterium]
MARRWFSRASSFPLLAGLWGFAGPRQIHFLVTLALTFGVVYLQAYVFARSPNPWFHVDLTSILVVYVSVEHFLLGAFLRVLVAGLLMQSLSLAPSGFFPMYFIVALVSANVVSRYVVLHNLSSQFLTFAGIFLLKFVLLYVVLFKLGQNPDVWAFASASLPQFVVTTLLSVPAFSLLARLDSSFEFAATRDRRAELVENL